MKYPPFRERHAPPAQMSFGLCQCPDQDSCVHSDDLATVRDALPHGSVYGRVLRKRGRDGDWLVLAFGDATFRVREHFWRPLPDPAFEVDDIVSVLSRDGANTPHSDCTIIDVVWHHKDECAYYFLRHGNRRLSKRYAEIDLRKG